MARLAEAPPTLHATALLFGARAVLLRGPSGAGKSRIALELLDEARRIGRFAALICDDRVVVEAVAGRLIARAAPVIGGAIEVRSVGILPLANEPAGVVGLVVDVVDAPPPRLPEAGDQPLFAEIAGVAVPRLALWRGDPSPVSRLTAALVGADGLGGWPGQNTASGDFVT